MNDTITTLEPSLNAHVNALERALLRADKAGAEIVLKKMIAVDNDLRKVEIAIVSALERIGSNWEKGKVSLSEIYLSGRICESITKQLFPELVAKASDHSGCAIAILNDYHKLGKSIVLSALRSAGFFIQDWDRMTPEQLVPKVLENNIDVLLISALMLPSALAVEEVRKLLDAAGFKGLLLVGGAPFRIDKSLWREVGADATADNATECIRTLSKLLSREQ